MKDSIFDVPAAFNGYSVASSVFMYHYLSNKPVSNQKTRFEQNVICFLIEGNKELCCAANGKTVIDNSKVLIIASGNKLMTERLTSSHSYRSILLFFSDDFLRRIVAENNILFADCKSKNREIATITKDPYLHNFEESLTLIADNDANRRFIENKTSEVILYLLDRHYLSISGVFKKIATETLPNPLVEIVRNPDNMLRDNSELAFLCNMSLSTFKRKFSNHFGVSPQSYFRDMRMKKAEQLLGKGKKSSEIYHELGYENISAFSKQFKKSFGYAPTFYKTKNELIG